MHFVFDTMGTTVHLTAFDDDTEKCEHLAKQAEQIFIAFDMRFSRFREDSELTAINTSAGKWVPISKEMSAVLQKSLALSEKTGGIFDISVGGHLAERGYGLPRLYQAPTPPPTYRDIELDVIESRVRCAPHHVLEPAALVKGIAIDAAAVELSTVSAFMLNVGGDILTHGSHPEYTDWNVAIQHPRNRDAVVTVVSLHDEAIATSGSYEVGGTHKGATWHHQIDMQRGTSVSDILSVSVIAPTAEEADTHASVGFLYGLHRGIAYLETTTLPYCVIASDEQLFANTLFKDRERSW